MAFTPDVWADGKEGDTPITAAELNRIEEAGASAAKTATWGEIDRKPTAFKPADHKHAMADVDGLTAALQAVTDRLDALEGETA